MQIDADVPEEVRERVKELTGKSVEDAIEERRILIVDGCPGCAARQLMLDVLKDLVKRLQQQVDRSIGLNDGLLKTNQELMELLSR